MKIICVRVKSLIDKEAFLFFLVPFVYENNNESERRREWRRRVKRDFLFLAFRVTSIKFQARLEKPK